MLSIYSFPYSIDLIQGKNLKRFQNGFFESKIFFPDDFMSMLTSDVNLLKSNLIKSKPTTKWVTLQYANTVMRKTLQAFDADNDFILKKYIGNYAVDICYLFGTKYGSDHRNSQHWHHDSVGKRLKMFFVLEPDNEPTLLIESNSGINRMLNPVLSEKKRKSYKPKSDISSIRFLPGHVYFVDTNYMHSGIKGVTDSIRIAFVCEISNKYKKYARGRVGPRSEP